MIRPKTVTKKYIEKDLLSSSPNKVVLKLYEGAIGFLISAINRLEDNDIIKKAKLLDKAVNIINYLRSCLDMEKGGEISENLNRLYEYILLQITEGNIKNDAGMIKVAVELLREIRDGWAAICDDNIEKAQNKGAEKSEVMELDTAVGAVGNTNEMNQPRESFSAVA